MENILEAVILGGGNDEDIEYVILDNIIIDRDHVQRRVNNFDIEELDDEDVKLNFRFEREHIRRLLQVLQIPAEIVADTRHKVSGLTALCILLKRLAYPNRLSDICKMFSLSPQSLSQIINKITNLIIENHGQLLNNLNELHWLNEEKLQYYAQAIENKGGAVNNCWGFIDGTCRQICRPSVQQQEYYSGHKRVHCVKYQSVLCPDGIIVSLKGGFPGRRHDAGIFRESNLYQELEENMVFNDIKYVLYGDQAYGVRGLLLSPFPGRPQDLPIYQQEFNNSMKTLRVAVEWGFQKIISEFAFVDFKKNQKLLVRNLEAIYKTATLLTNCHTCLYSNQTALYFNVEPPTLEEYFNL